MSGGRARLRELKQLQDVSALCDAQVAAQELATAVQMAGAERVAGHDDTGIIAASCRDCGSAKRAQRKPTIATARLRPVSVVVASGLPLRCWRSSLLAARPAPAALSRPRISRRLPGSRLRPQIEQEPTGARLPSVALAASRQRCGSIFRASSAAACRSSFKQPVTPCR